VRENRRRQPGPAGTEYDNVCFQVPVLLRHGRS
jgi:hypothetical protein